jgi:hypothetical protein
MSSDRTVLIPFLRLPEEWAAVSGLTPHMVMRRLCDWVVAGAFPSGSLIDQLGKEVPTLDIYQAYLAVINNGQAYVDGTTSYLDSGTCRELLAKLLVTQEGLQSFCERTNTYPPPSILQGFRRAWVIVRSEKNQAPPECSDAKMHAARQQARRTAEGWLNNLSNKLAGLQGKPVRFGPHREDNSPIDMEYWNAQWQDIRSRVMKELPNSESPDLQRQLETLDADWAALLAAERAAFPDTTEPSPNRELADTTTAQPRLVLKIGDQSVILDGKRYELPPKPFALLLALCRKALGSAEPVQNSELEKVLWGDEVSTKFRPVRDVVRDLRDRLPNKMLVDNNRTLGGYRLVLPKQDIAIED